MSGKDGGWKPRVIKDHAMQTFSIGQEIVKKSASIENDNKQENPQELF